MGRENSKKARCMKTLKPHQSKCWDDYLQGRNRAALILDMRLGKTILAIQWAYKLERVLVVCPFSCLIPWEEELEDARLPVKIMQAPEWRKLNPEYQTGMRIPEGWYCTNYESLRVCPFVTDVPWDAVILDESVTIKNPQAKISKLCIERFWNVQKKAILTGIPDPEGPLDLVCQYLFLRGRFCGYRNFWEFREAMFENMGYDWIPKPGTREVMMEEMAKYSYILKKEDAGLGNERIYEKRYIKMNSKQKALQKQILEEWRTDEGSTKWSVVIHSWMQRIASGFAPESLELISDGKIRELLGMLTGELKKEKVVVFFKFNNEMKEVMMRLKAKNIKVSFIHGMTPRTKRKSRIKSLGKKNGIRILLCQQKCVRFGLNLSAASVGIFFSNVESANDRAQSIERLEHMDKNHSLLYIDLITQGSIDESIVDSLTMKISDSKFFLRRVRKHFEAMMGVA
jgi:SNF2 family DNA or RNA helicase